MASQKPVPVIVRPSSLVVITYTVDSNETIYMSATGVKDIIYQGFHTHNHRMPSQTIPREG